MLAKSLVYTTCTFKSSLLIREPSGLVLKDLPPEAQMSPVFAIEVTDVDIDGKTDLLLGGNYYKIKPEIGRLDGFDGGYLKGNSDGTFVYVSSPESGLKISGEVRSVVSIGGHILYARNNQPVVAFKRK